MASRRSSKLFAIVAMIGLLWISGPGELHAESRSYSRGHSSCQPDLFTSVQRHVSGGFAFDATAAEADDDDGVVEHDGAQVDVCQPGTPSAHTNDASCVLSVSQPFGFASVRSAPGTPRSPPQRTCA